MKRKRARPGQRYGAYVYLALKNQPSYIALENGKVLALENQSDCLVIEVPLFMRRQVRKYNVVDLTN